MDTIVVHGLALLPHSKKILGPTPSQVGVFFCGVCMFSSTVQNHCPTLNISSPDLLSALQNWHDGVILDSTPPLIASDEGMDK